MRSWDRFCNFLDHVGPPPWAEMPLLEVQSGCRITKEENEVLTYPVSVKEVRGVLLSFGEDKTLRSDDFLPLFFCRYWCIVREEVVEAVQLAFNSREILEQ